jgi:hypothetical protein
VKYPLCLQDVLNQKETAFYFFICFLPNSFYRLGALEVRGQTGNGANFNLFWARDA